MKIIFSRACFIYLCFCLSVIFACSSGSQNDNIGSGTNVYIAGSYFNGSVNIPCYWKNGVKTDLPSTGSATASSIFISGSDVYVAGSYSDSGNSVACYWKNGAKIDLNATYAKAEANAIFVKDNDVYVAGLSWNSTNPNPFSRACYWKNGVKTDLFRVCQLPP